MTLRLLPQTLINQIAAGEVVERPASVVKELVENALDAGATKIEVIIREGGKSLISIRDNGSGMTRDELILAVERHATSKLPDDDLTHIDSLGFRGEALPSIGSIARLSLTSRVKGGEAWCLRLEGGLKHDPIPAAAPEGTLMEVKDLFFATPARLKFLKTSQTEALHIQDVLEKLALSHPSIEFSLMNESKRMMSLSPSDLKGRVFQLLGKEFQENCFEVEAEREGYRLYGLASLPTFHRSNSALQYCFVNRRCVKDKLLAGALRSAYQDVLFKEKHPIVVLYLEVPSDELDVNVHPAKTEVRFQDSQRVRSLLVGALKEGLRQFSQKSATTLTTELLERAVPSAQAPQRQVFPTIMPRFNPSSFQKPSGSLPSARPQPSVDQSSFQEQEKSLSFIQAPEKIPDHPLGRARAQVHQTYIIAETSNGMIVVDQHAVHERLLYEDLKKQLYEGGISRQLLLIPEIVELTPQEAALLIENLETLDTFGMGIEPFGGNSILIREVPSLLGDCDLQGLIKTVAGEMDSLGDALALKEKMHEILSTFACHSSIRAGRSLSLEEMNGLLRQMEKTPYTGQCNHGRPTYVELQLKDIEKLFGRK